MAAARNKTKQAETTRINGAGILPSGNAGVHLSHVVADMSLGSAIFSESAWGAISLKLRLSARERQIARGILDNQKESAIADNLHISPHTVHGLSRRLYARLKLNGRPSLILRLTRELLVLSGKHPDVPPICPAYQSGKCLLAETPSSTCKRPTTGCQSGSRSV